MDDGGFAVELVDDVPVVLAPEEIDLVNVPELNSALLEAAAGGSGTLVADLTRTRFCDLAGLHTLVAAHKRAKAQGGELLLVIPHGAVLRVFTITGADRVIASFRSLDDALTHALPDLSTSRPMRTSRGGAQDPALDGFPW